MKQRIINFILDLIDPDKVARRVGFYFTLWLTYYSVTECVQLANNSDLEALGLAAVMAAITTPVTALQGFAFKYHYESKK